MIECRAHEAKASVWGEDAERGDVKVLLGGICWVVKEPTDNASYDARPCLFIVLVGNDTRVSS